MSQVILHLGSNQGDRFHHLEEAQRQIHIRIGAIQKRSFIYQTAAWGHTDQAHFLNLALLVETDLSPHTTLDTALQIEQAAGRQRLLQWGPRPLDIDLIFFDELVLESPRLILPHPWMAQRRFVLVPLADIIPNWIHPVLQKDVHTLLLECDDSSEVVRW